VGLFIGTDIAVSIRQKSQLIDTIEHTVFGEWLNGEPHGAAVGQGDRGSEHRVRAHPEAEVAVEQFVDDEEFLGLGVTGEGNDLVVLAFVVAVAAGAGLGGERGGGGTHLESGPTWVIFSLGK